MQRLWLDFFSINKIKDKEKAEEFIIEKSTILFWIDRIDGIHVLLQL